MTKYIDLTRRRFLPALALAAAAIPLALAHADTIFTSFGFPSITGSAPRTMPERLNDVFNVRDYGALGDGNLGNDNGPAIQAAVNAAANAGSTSGGTLKGATIFFPPGVYPVYGTITGGAAKSLTILGSGQFNTRLQAGIPNAYVIDTGHQSGVSEGVTFDRFQSISITNASTTTDSGAVAIRGATSGEFHQVEIGGYIGCDAGEGTKNIHFYGCSFNPVAALTGIGVVGSQVGIHQCSFNGLFIGARLYGNGHIVEGCRFEVNTTGLELGISGFDGDGKATIGGGAAECRASIVVGNSFESNDTAINSWNAKALIVGNQIYAQHGGTEGVSAHYGVRIAAGSVIFMGNNLDVKVSVVSMDLAGLGGGLSGGPHFIGFNVIGRIVGSEGETWSAMPSGAAKKIISYEYNQWRPEVLFLFSELPSGADIVETMTYDLADGTVASGSGVFGDIITGGTGNPATGIHCKIRANDSGEWILTAK